MKVKKRLLQTILLSQTILEILIMFHYTTQKNIKSFEINIILLCVGHVVFIIIPSQVHCSV